MRPTAVIERRAGLFRTEYEAATLRENLGLQVPGELLSGGNPPDGWRTLTLDVGSVRNRSGRPKNEQFRHRRTWEYWATPGCRPVIRICPVSAGASRPPAQFAFLRT